jgi:hypothetical protein
MLATNAWHNDSPTYAQQLGMKKKEVEQDGINSRKKE